MPVDVRRREPPAADIPRSATRLQGKRSGDRQASTALPPSRGAARPASVASGWSATAIPCSPSAAGRSSGKGQLAGTLGIAAAASIEPAGPAMLCSRRMCCCVTRRDESARRAKPIATLTIHGAILRRRRPRRLLADAATGEVARRITPNAFSWVRRQCARAAGRPARCAVSEMKGWRRRSRP